MILSIVKTSIILVTCLQNNQWERAKVKHNERPKIFKVENDVNLCFRISKRLRYIRPLVFDKRLV